jgi:hypothetical protein
MHEGKIAMRDAPDTVIEKYMRFLDVGESEVAQEDV